MTTRRVLPTRRQVTSRRIRYAAPALEKGLDILELLASVSEALTHSEIASRLGRTINGVFRMLVCLDERGYISRTGPDERYQSSGCNGWSLRCARWCRGSQATSASPAIWQCSTMLRWSL
jgi:hypothetical protein